MGPLLPNRRILTRNAIAVSLFQGTAVNRVEFHDSSSEWSNLLQWLDTSGLALLLFDHLRTIGELDCLPLRVQQRLAANLRSNSERVQSMNDLLYSLNTALLRAGVEFAVLKGVSLWPRSAPRLELRSQLDLDFLVSPEHLQAAQAVLAEHGFHLHARCDGTYEYKTAADPPRSLAELYSVHPCQCVELHVANTTPGLQLLRRSVPMSFAGHTIPVLASCDLFLGQARHLYKHIASPFFRVAHVLEFARHMHSFAVEDPFWRALRTHTDGSSDSLFRLAFCVRFCEQSLHTPAPAALTSWTSDAVPDLTALWIDRYATRLIALDFPGSKLYLLLQHEAGARSAGSPGIRLRRSLLPCRLPPPITHAPLRESIGARGRRFLREAGYILSRLRFHVVSGAHLLAEWPRWRRAIASLEQSSDIALTDP